MVLCTPHAVGMGRAPRNPAVVRVRTVDPPWRFILKTFHLLASLSLISIAGALQAQTLSVSPTSVALSAQAGSTTVVQQTINVSTTSGNPEFIAQIAASQGTVPTWLSLSSSAYQTVFLGAAPGSFVIYVNPANLTAGSYTANVDVSLAGGSGNQIVIPVTLSVSTISVSPQPPVQMTYVQGSGTFPSASLQLTSSAFNQYTT